MTTLKDCPIGTKVKVWLDDYGYTFSKPTSRTCEGTVIASLASKDGKVYRVVVAFDDPPDDLKSRCDKDLNIGFHDERIANHKDYHNTYSIDPYRVVEIVCPKADQANTLAKFKVGDVVEKFSGKRGTIIATDNIYDSVFIAWKTKDEKDDGAYEFGTEINRYRNKIDDVADYKYGHCIFDAGAYKVVGRVEGKPIEKVSEPKAEEKTTFDTKSLYLNGLKEHTREDKEAYEKDMITKGICCECQGYGQVPGKIEDEADECKACDGTGKILPKSNALTTIGLVGGMLLGAALSNLKSNVVRVGEAVAEDEIVNEMNAEEEMSL